VKILYFILIALISLLSVVAGLAKVLQVPQEVQFLQMFGFNSTLVISYGVIQVCGGILLAIPKTIKIGATITMFAFGLSTLLIGINGDYIFALISLLPIALTALIFKQSSQLAAK